MGAVATHFNQCRVYQRNLDSCVRAAQRNIDPTERGRYNTPEGGIIEDPKVSDLGDLTEQMAQTLLIWSHQLEELGELLIKDEVYPEDRSSYDFQRAKRLIQNNFDACRYASPQVAQFAKFVVPLGRDPGLGMGGN